MVRGLVSAHELLTVSFISFALLYNLVGFRWLHISFTFFCQILHFLLSIASNKEATECRWDSQLHSLISITVSLHSPFQLTGVRTFLQFSLLQTRLKKKHLKGANWKSQEKKKIQCVQNTLFLFQLPNQKFTCISKWKALLRSKCSLSICVRTKIKSATVWKPKWNAMQSVWLVTHQRAGNQSLRRSWAGVSFRSVSAK